MALSERDRAILDFERTWWTEPGPKDAAIRTRFGVSPTRYYRLLNEVLDSPDAMGYDPLVVLQKIQAKLNLNTSQQQQWDTAVAQSKTAHDAIRANFQQLKAATQAELAKFDPDLAALASLSDQLQQQNIAQRKLARAAWLALYGTFSSDQKTTVKDAINARMARMDAFRQRMQDRLSGG